MIADFRKKSLVKRQHTNESQPVAKITFNAKAERQYFVSYDKLQINDFQ